MICRVFAIANRAGVSWFDDTFFLCLKLYQIFWIDDPKYLIKFQTSQSKVKRKCQRVSIQPKLTVPKGWSLWVSCAVLVIFFISSVLLSADDDACHHGWTLAMAGHCSLLLHFIQLEFWHLSSSLCRLSCEDRRSTRLPQRLSVTFSFYLNLVHFTCIFSSSWANYILVLFFIFVFAYWELVP